VEVILDTNAVSDFADANQRLLNCLQQSAADIHLPAIVLGEYRSGQIVQSRSQFKAARLKLFYRTRCDAPVSQWANG
jgi:predicted nucleic acid-binding protein